MTNEIKHNQMDNIQILFYIFMVDFFFGSKSMHKSNCDNSCEGRIIERNIKM